MFKFIVTIVVLLIAGAALWWTGLLSQWVPSIPTYSALMGTNATTTEQTPQTPTNNTEQQPVNDLPTATNDASDDALAKDAAAMDAELTVLAGDSASAQNSLNDKPVTQEY